MSSLSRADTELPPEQDITALLQSAAFDPTVPGSCLLAVVADTHMYLDPSDNRYTDRMPDVLVNDLNGLHPPVNDLVFAGDIAVSHSVVIGGPRYPSHYERTRQEFRVALEQMRRFRPDIAIWKVPGNHDTDRFEVEPDLWLEETGGPAYQLISKGGVPVFLLNSGHAGGLNQDQLAWFELEAAKIDADQEVLIIAHHPTFFHSSVEGALKKMVARVFAGHRAPIWLVGGHNHGFGEKVFTDNGTRFIQLQVTTGNPKMFNDGRSPGYILLGLQSGSVVCRIFRQLKTARFEVRAPLNSLPSSKVEWAFEKVPYPGELFLEGFYERQDRVVSFNASDLTFHFVFVQHITFRIRPDRFGGKLTEFLILGVVGNAAKPTAKCSFSLAGAEGTWLSFPIPSERVGDVYKIAIPEGLRNVPDLHVRISTDLPTNQSDFQVVGWGTAAAGENLTGYERWISLRYRTFSATDAAAPEAIDPKSGQSNAVRFAFNLPDEFTVNDLYTEIGGLPEFSVQNGLVNYNFYRRKASSNPGISYIFEESQDLKHWSPVQPERVDLIDLNERWERVNLIPFTPNSTDPTFFRVRLEL